MMKKIKNDLYNNNAYLISRIYKEYITKQKKYILFVIFCMLIIATTTGFGAWVMKPVLDDIFFKKDAHMIVMIPCLILLNAIIKGVAEFFQLATMKIIGQKVISNIQMQLYKHLIYSDIRYLIKFPAGNLISRFTNDINIMRNAISDSITTSFKQLFTLIGLVGVMFYMNYTLALIAIFIIPIAFYPLIRIAKRIRKISKGMQEELGDFTIRLDETFKNIRVIKSYCREDYEVLRASKVVEKILVLYKKAAYIEAAPSPIMETLGGITVGLVVFYGGSEVIAENTTAGEFFAFIAAMLTAYRPLKAISMLYPSIQEGLAATRRLYIMMDEKPIINDNPQLPKEKFISYSIKFENVYFSYKRNGEMILDGLSIMIPQGKTVALVGSSGSGKTTILNLLQRLYDANYGNITIGGKNITDIRLLALRQAIALVSQEIALFDDTVLENIRYGKLDATDDEIIDASMAAAAHDFIEALPQKYNTHIGQHGIKLSGGQRQRLAIAMAILKNAPILLLDEATSALDTISEKQVQLALEYLKKGRTTIIIAHRLSTIERADIIYVIDGGNAVECGTHNELLEKNGVYSKLYNQYKSYKIIP